MKWRRREILCDWQIDRSLPVNQISRGGGDAAVAPLAYFPPFTSQFILLGTLEVQYMEGVQPRLACRRKTGKKWLHSRGVGRMGGRVSQHTYCTWRGNKGKNGPVIPCFHLYTLHFLSLYSHGASCVFSHCLDKLSPSRCSYSWKKRSIEYLDRLTYISVFPCFPSHSSFLTLSRVLRLLSVTELQQVDK